MSGDWRTFFKLWNLLIPEDAKQTRTYKTLTLNLYVYFIMLPKHKTQMETVNSITSLRHQDSKCEENFNTEIEKNMNDSMDELCKFLNSTGKELEDDMELRPFFALPFIENPCTEPSLSKVFEKSWVDKVTENLYLFLKKYEQQNFSDMRNNDINSNKTSLEHESGELQKDTIIKKIAGYKNIPIIPNDRNIPLFLENYEVEEQYTLSDDMKYNQKSKSIQTVPMHSCTEEVHSSQLVRSNKKLIQCTQELAATNSHLCTIRSNYEKLKIRFHKLHADYHKLMSIARVLTTALENSVKGQTIDFQTMLETCIRIFPDLFNQNIKDSSYCSSELLLDKSHSGMKIIEHSKSYVTPIPPKLLNFKKIKLHLINGSTKTKLFLLQALRRKMTLSQSGERDEVIHEYISRDLLGLHGQIANYKGKSILPYLLTPDNIIMPHPLQQSTTRLLNALASFRCGRDYLSFDSTVVDVVYNCLKNTSDNDIDTFTCNMMIAMLQKLSVRKQQRIYMIENGLVEWLIHHLHDQYRIMNSYRLEYATALLMNLSLHQIAQRRASSMASLLISTLTDLLLIDHTSVLPYVNRALNNFLTNRIINEVAKKLKFSSLLEQYSKQKNGEMRKHLDYILKIHRGEITIETEIEEMADNDNEEFDVLENELEENDPVKHNYGELCGESLLTSCYSVLPKTSQEKELSSDVSLFKQFKTNTMDSVIYDDQEQIQNLYSGHASISCGKHVPRSVHRRYEIKNRNNTTAVQDLMKKTYINSKLHVHKLISSSSKGQQVSLQNTNKILDFPSKVINNLKGSESVTENYVEIDTNTHLNILKNHYKDIVLNTQIQLPKQFNVNIPTNRRTKKKSSKSTQLKVLKNNMNSVDENYNESAVYLYENQSSKKSSKTTFASSMLLEVGSEAESTIMQKLSSIASLNITNDNKAISDNISWIQENELDSKEAFLSKPKLPRTPP
ncbi:lisH domain-containing protein ARMC9 isoform X2 [Ptiloglossa arizonensis]